MESTHVAEGNVKHYLINKIHKASHIEKSRNEINISKTSSVTDASILISTMPLLLILLITFSNCHNCVINIRR